MQHDIRWLGLQLFAETGGTAADGTGAEADSGAEVAYGRQPEQQAPDAGEQQAQQPERNLAEEFEKLIKGEYKEAYNKRMQDTVQRRLKGPNAELERYRTLQPVLEMLGNRYGVDATDVKALSAAMEEDDSYYQADAEKMGLDVKQVKLLKRAERENQQLKAQLAEQENRVKMEQNIARWMQEAQGIAQKYPNLDLQQELNNPQFFNALMNGASVEGAYWGLYHDQLIPQAMQFTAQETERKISNRIQAQGQRPVENGAKAAVQVKSDVSQLTDDDIDEIIKRARRGEKIVF